MDDTDQRKKIYQKNNFQVCKKDGLQQRSGNRALVRSKVNPSIVTGVKIKNMHPEARDWVDVMAAAYRNSLLIVSIFFSHDLRRKTEDLVLKAYKERKMHDQLFRKGELWYTRHAAPQVHVDLGVMNLEQANKYGWRFSS